MTDYIYDSTVELELEKSGIYASITRGTSMRPLLKTGRDVVLLKKCTIEPKRFDVVLYRTPEGKYLLHRIIKVREAEFIIRGDNTFTKEHVAKDRILAMLTDYNRKGKRRSTSNLGFRIYSRVWNLIYPVRYVIHKALSLARKVYHFIFRRNKKGC